VPGALADAEDLLEVVTDLASVSVAVCSRDLRYLWVSSAYREWLGVRAEEIVGRKIVDVVGESAFAAVLPRIERALRGEVVEWRDHLDFPTVGRRFIRGIYRPSRDGFVAVTMEVKDDAAEALRESELRFHAVFDQASDGMILMDDDMRVIDANPAAVKLLGVAREQMIGRPSSDFGAGEGGRPADVTSFRREGTARGQGILRRPDGTTRAVEFWASAHVVPGIHVSVFRDIEERKRTEETIRFLEEASRILGSSLDYGETLGAVVRLAVPRIADWAAIDMLEEGVFRRVAVAHVDPEKVAIAEEIMRRQPLHVDDEAGIAKVVRTGVPELHSVITRGMLDAGIADPELRALFHRLGLISSMTIPLRVHDRVVGAFSLVSAESGRHFNEADFVFAQELARRAGTAMEHAIAYRESVDANRLKDEFLATVSHELRTPLTAILGWARLLRTKRDVDIAKAVEIIERNAKAQVRLIEDVLDVSRIITGKLKIDVRPIDVSKVLRAAIEVVGPAAAAKDLTISEQIAAPVWIEGDPDRMQQVFWNLLSNAVKFTPKGGRIDVILTRATDHVEVAVKDTGRGIKPDFLPHVFERFRQADSSTTRSEGGLGLGLAIVRHLVDVHGGHVHVESEGVGKGATFTITLPVRAGLAREDSIPPASVAGLPLSGLRVLVVDDDSDARDLLEQTLASAGAEVRLTGEAREALDVLVDFKPDVLVSDIGLPMVDGYQLMRRIRELDDSRGGRTPAIAVTAYTRGDDARRAFLAGFQMHLGKPIDPDALVAMVANLAGRIVKNE
jgi:PAS domain S-box-containing protein